MDFVIPETRPVNVGEAIGAFRERRFVTEPAKSASSPSAAANSLRVLSAPGAESTTLFTAAVTKAVVATCVVFVPAAAVGSRPFCSPGRGSPHLGAGSARGISRGEKLLVNACLRLKSLIRIHVRITAHHVSPSPQNERGERAI
jgi:hypothetical protein